MLIDLHNHLLWDCDDGPGNEKNSLKMLHAAERAGIGAIVCTPHRFHPAISSPDTATVASRLQILREQTGIHLLAGAEHYFSPELIDALDGGPTEACTLQGRCLLVEFGQLLRPAALSAFLQKLRRAGLDMILAHPERTPFASDLDFLQELENQGCFFLLNAGSLTGREGHGIRRAARKLLELGFGHFVASDAHSADDLQTYFPRAYAWVRKTYGEAAAFLLFSLNPWLVLHRKQPHPFEQRTEVPQLIAHYLKEPH